MKVKQPHTLFSPHNSERMKQVASTVEELWSCRDKKVSMPPLPGILFKVWGSQQAKAKVIKPLDSAMTVATDKRWGNHYFKSDEY